MRSLSLLILAVSIGLSSSSTSKAVHLTVDSVSEIFRDEGVTGTFIAASIDGDVSYFHNRPRAEKRFSPASTFKIPNTLIALNAGVVDSTTSTFTWDGVDRGLARWNKNQTLASAFKVSCVWCYQVLAKAVGRNTYESALADLDYGNQVIGSQIDLFWLDDSLQISATEQIEFLRRLYNDDLPYPREHTDALKEIMVTRKTAQYTLYAKTGWAQTEPQVAWYVGFVESKSGTWLFAMNMQVDAPEQAALRTELVMRSLEALEII